MKRLGFGEFKRIGLSNLPTEGPESVESYRLLFETLAEVAGLIKKRCAGVSQAGNAGVCRGDECSGL